MTGYGDAIIKRDGDRLIVERADEVIGISVELLAEAVGWGLYVDNEGLLLLAGDPNFRYRPVRFDAKVAGLEPGQATEGARVLVCQRVREAVA